MSNPCRISILMVVAWAALCPATMLRADPSDDQFAVAAGHYDHGRWKLAVEEFRAFLETYPHDRRAGESVFLLGEALLQAGQFDDARRQFQSYIHREPQGKYVRPATFRVGEAAYLAGDFERAKPDLVRFLTEYPGDRLNAFVLPYLGDIALAGSDAAAAAGYFRDGLSQFPNGRLQDDCRIGLARALETQNQPEEAERLYRAVTNKAQSTLADAAQYHLGALQYNVGRYEQAIVSFSAFDDRLAASPWRPNAWLGHGLALLKLKRPAEAIKQFDAVLAATVSGAELSEQALRGQVQAALDMKEYAAEDRWVALFQERFPKSPIAGDVQRMLARSLVERKQYARAVALLESLIGGNRTGRLGPQDLENRYLLAVSYEGLNRYDDALAAVLPVVNNAGGPLKADAELTHGSLLIALRKYADAIGPLEAFLAGKPAGDADVKARGELAICCARTGQIEKAKRLYAELVGKYPTHPLLAPTTEHLAEAAYDAGDAAWSAELSRRLAADAASAQYAIKGKLGLGWSQFQAGKLAEAAATFDELLKSNPPEAIAAEAALARGQILEKLGQDESALAMFDLVIERYSGSQQHADALRAAARLHDRLKQPAQAASLYQRLAREHPEFSKLDAVLYDWAWTLRELGKMDEADRLFERLRNEFPQGRFQADARYRLAQRAFDAKDYGRAGSLIDEALAAKADPQVREYAMFLRGEIAVVKADWPKVRELFKAVVKEFPGGRRRLDAEYWIAEADRRQGDYQAACSRFQRLVEQVKDQREPRTALVLLGLAQVLAQQEQWNDAYTIAAKIEKDYPDFAQQYEVDYVIGRCLANQADFDAARKAYNKVILSAAGAKTETAAMAQWMIGESYFHQKNYQAALREYLRLETLYAYPTWQAAALLEAGKCHQQLGEPTQAAELYRQILKDYSKTPFAEQAAKQLAAMGKKTP